MSLDEVAGARPKGRLAGNAGNAGGTNGHVSWHCLDIAGTLSALGSRSGGLNSAEAAERLTVHGPNELQAACRISPWSILFEQFKNVLIVILLVATALSAFLDHGIEALAITVIVLFAVILAREALFPERLVRLAFRPCSGMHMPDRVCNGVTGRRTA